MKRNIPELYDNPQRYYTYTEVEDRLRKRPHLNLNSSVYNDDYEDGREVLY